MMELVSLAYEFSRQIYGQCYITSFNPTGLFLLTTLKCNWGNRNKHKSLHLSQN